MTKRTLFFGSLFVAAAAFAIASSGAQDSAQIKLKFTKDTTLKYKTVVNTHMDVMGQGMDMEMEIAQTTTVVSQKDGWTTLLVVTDSMKATGDAAGQVSSALENVKGVVMRLDVDEFGVTRNIALENADKMDQMTRSMMEGSLQGAQAVGFMGFQFPKAGVKVGSTWNATIDAAKFMGMNEMITSVNGTIPVRFEVLGFENLDGVRNVKIKTTINGTMTMALATPAGDMNATMKMDSTTTSWVEVATGFLTKSEGTAQNDSDFGLGTMTQQISTKVSRIKS
jgi:hypothetical protein